MSPGETVYGIYAAFGRGDSSAILDKLADDVEWEYGAVPNPVPWLQPGRGRDAAVRFFQALGGVTFEHFAVKHVLVDGNFVAGVVDVTFTVKATGKRVVEVDEVHLWHFDAAGRVSRFRHRADTWMHARAAQAGE